MVDTQAKLTLTVQETATLLGIGRNSAYEAIKTGTPPSVQIGRRILVPRAALERMLMVPNETEGGDHDYQG